MVKLLICGDLEVSSEDDSSFSTLVQRVDALTKSSHGPFDILLVAGGLFKDERSYKESLESGNKLSVPTYAIDCPDFVRDGALPSNLSYLDRSDGGIARKKCGITTVNSLTVCWVNETDRDSPLSGGDMEELQSICEAPAYRGCDMLLSSSWPKNTHNFLNDKELDEMKTLNIALGAGSENVTKIAITCKPRYHFCGGDSARPIFYQRTPYTNPGGIHPTNAQAPATRLISLACIPLSNSNAATSKDKSKKWMHALGLEPIVYLKADDLLGIPLGSRCTDCPYVENNISNKRPLSVDDSGVQHMDKRFKADGQGQGTGVFFFGGSANDLNGARVGGRHEGNQRQQPAANLTPPSSSAVKLFIGNLPRDYSREQILRLLPGAVSLHRPLDKTKPRDPITGEHPMKNFCFVDFVEHNKARNVVDASVKKGVLMGGRTVTVGWAAEKQTTGKEQPPPPPPLGTSQPRLAPPPPPPPAADLGSQPPSADATVLFLGNLPPMTSRVVTSSGEVEDGDEDLYGGPDVDSILLQELHKKFIGIVSFNRVTNKRYAFVEFASHAEAYLAWQMSEKGASPTGGARGLKINNRVLSVAWASGARQYGSASCTASSEMSGKATIVAKVAPVGQAVLLLEAPDAACKTLFLGNVPPNASDQQLLQLVDEVTKSLKIRAEEEAGGAEVRHPEGKQFAFVTFPSHEITAKIMAARSTVGGSKQEVPEWKDPSTAIPSSSHTMVGSVKLCMAGRDMTLGWAKGKAADKRTALNGVKTTTNGGKGMSAKTDDHAGDCWFCLASGNLRTHLVLSVAEHCYMAMPRGALHPRHCLVSPIQCVPSKIHLSTSATSEFRRYEGSVAAMYRQEGMALLSFERAIRTRGKDHMQQHFVPVPKELVEGAEDAFYSVIKRHNEKHRERGGEGEPLQFVEVAEGETRGVEELVLSLPGGPFQEYFTISLPSVVSVEDGNGNSGHDLLQKRFIYTHEVSASSAPAGGDKGYSWRFPMQLGTELAASILKEPSKAFWKDCVVPEEEEVALSADFKRIFDPLDFAGEEDDD